MGIAVFSQKSCVYEKIILIHKFFETETKEVFNRNILRKDFANEKC